MTIYPCNVSPSNFIHYSGMKLLLFLCLLLSAFFLLVATLIYSLLLLTAMLLQMYRILIQQNDANR